MKDNIKLGGEWHKPTRNYIDPSHKEDFIVIGFLIAVLCLLSAVIIVGLFKLINP